MYALNIENNKSSLIVIPFLKAIKLIFDLNLMIAYL